MEIPKPESPTREISRASSADSSTIAYASPKEISPRDAALLETEVATLTKTIKSVSNEAARTVTRQNWRKCIIGTEKDQSFFVRAILKYSSDHVYQRALEEYGDKLIKVASDDFLDRALEARLYTIEAKSLLALLAKTKRLGYDDQDEVDTEEDVLPAQNHTPKDSKLELDSAPDPKSQDTIMADRMNPSLEELHRTATAATAAALAATAQAALPYAIELPNRPATNVSASRRFVCPDCKATFAQSGGLTYHMERRVCHRPAPTCRWFCKSCGKGFTTSGGKLYHEQNKVCENHETARATGRNPPSPHEQIVLRSSSSPLTRPGPQQYASGPMPSPAPPSSTPAYVPQPVPHGNTLYSSPALSAAPFSTGPVKSQVPVSAGRMEGHAHIRPNYPEFRTSFGSSTQSTPLRSSPGIEPSSGDVPVLDAVTQAELNSKIAAEVARFEQKCKEIPDTLSAAEREEEINKQKRGHATRKSQIRKKYGIQVRTSKLRPANFARLPGPDSSPRLEPISRIHAFRAPPAAMTPTFTVSTPASMERDRIAPLLNSPDPKRRRLDDPASVNGSSEPENRTDSDNYDGGLKHKTPPSGDENEQLSENMHVDELDKPEEMSVVELPPPPKPQSKKVPVATAQKQWEALQPIKTPIALPSLPVSRQSLSPITNRATQNVTITSISGSGADSGADTDSDPDEDIPSKIPSSNNRRSRKSSTSLSTSPGPVLKSNGSTKGLGKRTGSGHFPGTITRNGSKLRAAVPV